MTDFSYIPTQPGQPKYNAPMFFVKIESERIAQTYALVDSGATITTIPRGISNSIGLNKQIYGSPQTTVGASGNFSQDTAILKKLTILNGNEIFDTLENIDVAIPRHNKLPIIILGRDILFNKYEICFHEQDQKFSLNIKE